MLIKAIFSAVFVFCAYKVFSIILAMHKKNQEYIRKAQEDPVKTTAKSNNWWYYPSNDRALDLVYPSPVRYCEKNQIPGARAIAVLKLLLSERDLDIFLRYPNMVSVGHITQSEIALLARQLNKTIFVVNHRGEELYHMEPS